MTDEKQAPVEEVEEEYDIKQWILKEDNALGILEELSGRDLDDLGDAEEDNARELVKSLGCFAPAIEIAGGFLNAKADCSFSDFKALVEKAAVTDSKDLSGEEQKLLAAFLAAEEVRAQEERLNDLIQFLAWSGPEPMRGSLAAAALDEDEVEASWKKTVDLGTDLRVLFKATGEEEESDEEKFSLHLALRKVLRIHQTLTGKDEWITGIAHHLGDWFEARRKESGQSPEFSGEIAHLGEWLKHVEPFSTYDTARLTWLSAYPPFHNRELEKAKVLVEKSLELLEKHTGGEDDGREIKKHMLTDLGYILADLGDHKTALERQELALAIQVELHGAIHEESADILSYIGNTHESAGDLDQAVEYFKRALKIRMELFGAEHLETADSINNLGTAYYQAGKYKDAIGYLEQALLLRTRFQGEEDHETTLTLYNLAISLIHVKRFKEAYDWVNKYLKKIPGDHPQYRELANLLPYIDSECVKSGFRPPSGVKSGGGGGKKKKNKKKKKKK